jgi:hypothetical protein
MKVASAWNRVASHRLWTFLLITIGSAGSVIYPHPPLVAFGALAGITLTPKRALRADRYLAGQSVLWLWSIPISSNLRSVGIGHGIRDTFGDGNG